MKVIIGQDSTRAATTNKVICAFPWHGVNYSLGNGMGPCCATDITKDVPIQDYWNSGSIQEIRSDMLAGVRNEKCNYCYKLEDAGAQSRRQVTLPWIDSAALEKKGIDVKLTDLVHAEVRFSNICNFKCRMCNSYSSSLVAAENGDTPIVRYPLDTEYALLDEIKSCASTLESITFSGGEPLMHQQHYDLLDYLIANNYTPQLSYFSNGSLLTYKGKHVADKWQHFPNVVYGVSIDAIGVAAEYWRHGTRWDEIIAHVDYLREHAPKVQIKFHVAIGWVNAINAVAAIKFLQDKYSDCTITIGEVYHDLFSLTVASQAKKRQIEEAFRSLYHTTVGQDLLGLTQIMYNIDNSANFAMAQVQLAKTDTMRNESFLRAFPEHMDLL